LGFCSDVLDNIPSLVSCIQSCQTDIDRGGEPPCVLAYNNETMARRAYAHKPTEMQSELARD